MSALPPARLSPEEYLAFERPAETKSEFFDGGVFAMAGGSATHAQPSLAFGGELRQALKATECVVFSSDARIRATRTTYVYPDVSVVCGKAVFADERQDVLLNPIVVVEVLSDATEANDWGLKFARYRQMEPLEESVLVSQREPRVEMFRRLPDGRWWRRQAAGQNPFQIFGSVLE
jgi:Uma2 family endonuclease